MSCSQVLLHRHWVSQAWESRNRRPERKDLKWTDNSCFSRVQSVLLFLRIKELWYEVPDQVPCPESFRCLSICKEVYYKRQRIEFRRNVPPAFSKMEMNAASLSLWNCNLWIFFASVACPHWRSTFTFRILFVWVCECDNNLIRKHEFK